MLDFSLFQYAAPPRCGTGWIRRAAGLAGLSYHGTSYTFPHLATQVPPPGVLRISCVRSPDRWLASYYAAVWPQRTGVPAIDWLADLPGETFEGFVWAFLCGIPGRLAAMWAAYNADSILRLEDLPWGMVELLESLEVPRQAARACVGLPPQDVGEYQPWPAQLRKRVLDSEATFCERYDW